MQLVSSLESRYLQKPPNTALWIKPAVKLISGTYKFPLKNCSGQDPKLFTSRTRQPYKTTKNQTGLHVK